VATADAELAAIQALVAALEPLDVEARGRVIAYALSRFDIRTTAAAQSPAITSGSAGAQTASAAVSDIRSFKELKAPKTANEMAAVVAFYLSELAPEIERKDSITAADVRRYFKLANFPLPKEPRQTLINAKNSGYFDATSEVGTYRLNPVGYNLVAHGLPAGGAKPGAKSKQKRRASRGS